MPASRSSTAEHRRGTEIPQPSVRENMILNTHTNAKVVMREYQRTLDTAVINRNRVSEHQLQWLDVPASVGTGAYDNQARGWMDCPSWDGGEQRFTPLDGPGHKGVRP